jgi:HrpA-like RNA helicase
LDQISFALTRFFNFCFFFVVRNALETLLSLGALSPSQQLTELGKRMAELPLEPMLSKAVIVSKEFNCFEEILSIVSMLSVESIFYNPRSKQQQVSLARNQFIALEGDHLTLLAVYDAFQEAKDKKLFCKENFINFKAMLKVVDVRNQLVEYTQSIAGMPNIYSHLESESSFSKRECILRCLASAFFRHLAILQDDGRYRTLRDGKETFIHPSSSLFAKKKPKSLIYTELVSFN